MTAVTIVEAGPHKTTVATLEVAAETPTTLGEVVTEALGGGLGTSVTVQATALSRVEQSFVGGDNFIMRGNPTEGTLHRHFSTDSLLYNGCRVVLGHAAEELWVVHEAVVF